MKIAFPLELDPDNPKVVRDQDGQYILEAADSDVAFIAAMSINYVVSMPDPIDDLSGMEMN